MHFKGTIVVLMIMVIAMTDGHRETLLGFMLPSSDSHVAPSIRQVLKYFNQASSEVRHTTPHPTNMSKLTASCQTAERP